MTRGWVTSKTARADPVAVADADLVVAQPLDGEVLAELPVDEVVSTELALPVAVGVELVDEDGALLAAVPAEVALAVAVDVEPADPARAGDRILEDAGEDGLPLPGHVLRHADVDRQQGAGRVVAHAGPFPAATAAASRSQTPPISSTARLRSGPCATTVWPGAGSGLSPSRVTVTLTPAAMSPVGK